MKRGLLSKCAVCSIMFVVVVTAAVVIGGGVTVVVDGDICLFDVDNVVLTFAFVVIGVDEGNILYLLRLIEDTLTLFDEDVLSLKIKDNTQERMDWLHNDIQSLNAQIGCYECIIKDIKELINEVSR